MRRTAALIAAASLIGTVGATPVAESEPEPREPQPPTDSDGIPDRVSLESDSPYYFPHWQKLGVRHDGGEMASVVEFCVSEGWCRTQIFHGGRPKAERGKFVTIKRHGSIEPYWRRQQ